MRIMLVYCVSEDAGSAQDIHGYTRAARGQGHEVVLYGPPRAGSALRYSLDVASADAVVFVLEWWYLLHHGGHLNLVRLMAEAPRDRRLVVDCDGMYNDVVGVQGDYNHPDDGASRRRLELCDSLADRVLQPTLHPLRPGVGTFLFPGYDPAWEVPLRFSGKDFGMVYVGNNWFRWKAMRRVLEAIEPVRHRLGRIGIVGYGWDGQADWVEPPLRDHAYHAEPEHLARLGIEVSPAVPVAQVIPTMSRAVFNPVLTRPLFNRLRIVNPRLFETPAAGTIPLFGLDEQFVKEIYGEAAVELVLGPDATERIADVVDRPDHYAEVVLGIRRHLREEHSYSTRLRRLVDVVEGAPCA